MASSVNVKNCLFKKDLLISIGNKLENLASNVRSVKYKEAGVIFITFNEILKGSYRKYLDQIKNLEAGGESFIYIINTNTSSKDKDNLRENFKNAKETNSELKFAKINPQSEMHCALYVGSSRGSIANRIKQHLGESPAGTFSLRINKWAFASAAKGITIELLSFPNSLQAEVLQAIEDGLWDQFQPMFGRKGNK